MRFVCSAALAGMLVCTAPAAQASPVPACAMPLFSWSWLRAPFAWLASDEKEPLVCDGPACRTFTQRDGFRTFTFEVPDHGTGLYVDLAGSVQFRSAEIEFAGGGIDRLDLQYATRSDGIFELRDFGRRRDVRRVTLLVRSVSPECMLTVRFGRPIE